jgi:hypothetical protein
MSTLLLALLFFCGAALAADDPEAVYAKVHAAALAQDLEAMRAYVAEAERETLVLPEVPKAYRLTGKAARKDGEAVELRATGTADSVGLGYTQIFGVIGLVKEQGHWRVERLSWSTERPGEYPEGYVLVSGLAPEPRPSSTTGQPRFTLPPSPPERSRLYNPRHPDEKPDERVLRIERSRPCEIKPVMSDDDLRACGAQVPD